MSIEEMDLVGLDSNRILTGAVSGAGNSFELEHDAIHRDYRQLYDVYCQLRDQREALSAKAAGIDTASVSTRLEQVAVGSFHAGKAVGGSSRSTGGMVISDPGMLPAMLGLEAQLAKLLVDVHDSYASYLQTDAMSSDRLRAAGGAPATASSRNIPF